MRPRPPWFIAALGVVAGCIDTFGYLALGHLFTSHLTGNSGVLAIAIVSHDLGEAMRRGLVVGLFFAGAVVGALLVGDAARPRQLRRGLLVEAALLAATGTVLLRARSLGPLSPSWLATAALLSAAMGLQNAALAHPEGASTHTTHVTGPVTNLATDFVRWWRAPAGAEEPSAIRMRRFAARFFGFVAGGMAGALMYGSAPGWTPIGAAAAVLMLALAA